MARHCSGSYLGLAMASHISERSVYSFRLRFEIETDSKLRRLRKRSRGCGPPPDASKEDRQASPLEVTATWGLPGCVVKSKLGAPTKTGAEPATLFCGRIALIP